MERLARACGLPQRDLAFMYDTFEILAAAREYYFLPYEPVLGDRLRKLSADYRAKWPVRYAVHLDFARARLSRRALRVLFALLLRNRRGYRVLDRMFTLSLVSRLYPVLGAPRPADPVVRLRAGDGRRRGLQVAGAGRASGRGSSRPATAAAEGEWDQVTISMLPSKCSTSAVQLSTQSPVL
jgi:hypothetical protein